MSAPVSMSSKKRPPAVRQVIPGPPKGRDPRFDERCGKLDEQQFEKAYEFIADKRKKEIQTVKKKLKKAKNAEKKEELKRLLQSLKEQDRSRQEKARQRQAQTKRNKFLKESKGKFYLKRSDQKKLALIAKFDELKQKNRLNKALKNRRKHNLQKDRGAVSEKPTG